MTTFGDGAQVPCVFCLSEGAGRIRIDKKSRPYVICHACGTRSFLHSPEALRIYGFLAHGLIQRLRTGMIDATQAAAATQLMEDEISAMAAKRVA